MSKKHSSKVGIVVTTYEPHVDGIAAALEVLSLQGDLVVVCDNSEDMGISTALRRCCKTRTNTTFISMQGNQGIAAAQNTGIRHAVSEGCEFILEMDQDASIAPDYVESMLSSFRNLEPKQVAGIGAVSVDLNSVRNSAKKFVREADYQLQKTEKCLSAGFFFSAEAFQAVGPKDESLFIDYVDWEWCWRAKNAGWDTYLNTGLTVTHRLGERRLNFGFFDAGVPNPVRNYYQYRNSMLLMRKLHVPLRWKFERLFVNAGKFPFYVCWDKDRQTRRRYICDGVRDALAGVTGKYQGHNQ